MCTKRVILLSVIVSTLALASLASAANEVKHLQINEAHLIETSQNNFALTTPLLAQNGWKTVSVNGNNVLIVAPQCQQIIKTTDSLNQQERAALLNAKQQLNQVELGQANMLDGMAAYRSGSTTYSLFGQSQLSSFGRNINLSTFNNNGASISKYGDDSLSVSRPDLPNNLARLFVDKDVATFVYRDGQVMMRPVSCLQPQELQLLQQVKAEAQEAERQFQAQMQQFNQNMADWQQGFQQQMQNMNSNLQQNMQNMHQNLNGMFGNHQQQFQPYQQQQVADDFNGYNGNMFGQQQQQAGNFPFGPNNSPFWPGFPF